MDPRTTRDIIRRLDKLERGGVTLRIGELTNDSPFSVASGGSEVPYTNVPCIAAYSPTIGDRVAVLTQGNDLLVLYEINAGP